MDNYLESLLSSRPMSPIVDGGPTRISPLSRSVELFGQSIRSTVTIIWSYFDILDEKLT